MRNTLLLSVAVLLYYPAFAKHTLSAPFHRPLSDSLICPAQAQVACEHYDPSLWAYGQPAVSAGTCLDTLTSIVEYAQFDSICSRGTITRQFQALYCDGSAEACTQHIVVNHIQNFFIQFPDDIFSDFCDGFGNYGMPVLFGADCEMVEISYTDQFTTPVPIYCIKFERDWTVINWCTYNPMLGLVYVLNPTPFPVANNPNNLPGPIVSACGTAPPWNASVIKASPSDPLPTDYCTFWSPNANGYRYTQKIRVNDYIGPVFLPCDSTTHYFADSSVNKPEYWHLDLNGLDLAETAVDLSLNLTDVCSTTDVDAPYLLFLDLNADGEMETVISSVNPPPPGMVYYDNANTPNYLGGTLLSFDNRPVPTEEKWKFAKQRTASWPDVTYAIRWRTQNSPTNFVIPELPNGRHKIVWQAVDRCGNNSYCETSFQVGDTTLVSTNSPPDYGFALSQNEPNPFENSTRIRFTLPEGGTATLSIYDTEGRLRHRKTDNYAPGGHSVSLERNLLGASGMLFCKLEAGGNVAWRKLILL